jgi:hypothetical protein
VKNLLFLVIFVVCCSFAAKSQKIDSIYFNLYTDSLKKGPLHYNYINVDGKLSNGSYIPLDSTQVKFTCSAGKMMGNVLQLDTTEKADFVIVTAFLKENPLVRKDVKIYIKKVLTEEQLKTSEELIDGWQKQRKKN